jgi:hypothetical protein
MAIPSFCFKLTSNASTRPEYRRNVAFPNVDCKWILCSLPSY